MSLTGPGKGWKTGGAPKGQYWNSKDGPVYGAYWSNFYSRFSSRWLLTHFHTSPGQSEGYSIVDQPGLAPVYVNHCATPPWTCQGRDPQGPERATDNLHTYTVMHT